MCIIGPVPTTATPTVAERLVAIIESLIASLEAMGCEAMRPRFHVFGWGIKIPLFLIPNRVHRAAVELRMIRDAVVAITTRLAQNPIVDTPDAEPRSPTPDKPGPMHAKPARPAGNRPIAPAPRSLAPNPPSTAPGNLPEPTPAKPQTRPRRRPTPNALPYGTGSGAASPRRVQVRALPFLPAPHPQSPRQRKTAFPVPSLPLALFVTI